MKIISVTGFMKHFEKIITEDDGGRGQDHMVLWLKKRGIHYVLNYGWKTST